MHASNLTRGLSQSCGCLKVERTKASNTTHGYTRGKVVRSEYSTWQGMVSRCYNPNWINYAEYGGRGVAVCDRWRFGDSTASAFECFIADMGDKPSPTHTLERIRNDEPYSPGNCTWASRTSQARNRRSNRPVIYRGQEMLLCDALDASGLSESGFYARVAKGWTDSEALETPQFRSPSRLSAANS